MSDVVFLEFDDRTGRVKSSLQVPRWGDKAFELAIITIAKSSFSLELRVSDDAVGTVDARFQSGQILGTYRWKQQEYRLALTRDRIDAQVLRQQRRLQIPRDSPYVERPVIIRYDGGRISGGITLPRGDGSKAPMAVILGGSGARSWRPDIPGKPGADPWNWILSDHLTRLGLATLRIDSRGLGQSTGNYDDATLQELSDDARRAVKYVRSLPTVDPDRIAIVGVSQGGLIGAMCVARTKHVHYLVLLSTPGLPLREVYLAQVRDFGRWLELDENIIERRVRRRARIFDKVMDGLTIAEILADEVGGQANVPLTQALVDEISAAHTNLRRSELRHDPRTDFSQVTIPVLAIHGDRDIRVAPKNIRAIEHALAEGGNNDLTATTLPGLGHGLQRTKDGVEPSDGFTIAPEVLRIIDQWLVERVLRRGAPPGGQ